ncbi:Ubiquitin carboxyl-terminal hydrolase 21, partial [Blyttiomyces sp. JEL0837]
VVEPDNLIARTQIEPATENVDDNVSSSLVARNSPQPELKVSTSLWPSPHTAPAKPVSTLSKAPVITSQPKPPVKVNATLPTQQVLTETPQAPVASKVDSQTISSPIITRPPRPIETEISTTFSSTTLSDANIEQPTIPAKVMELKPPAAISTSLPKPPVINSESKKTTQSNANIALPTAPLQNVVQSILSALIPAPSSRIIKPETTKPISYAAMLKSSLKPAEPKSPVPTINDITPIPTIKQTKSEKVTKETSIGTHTVMDTSSLFEPEDVGEEDTESTIDISVIPPMPTNEITPPPPIPRKQVPSGFRNLGNTCFMNAVFQCLIATPYLVDYLLGESYLGDLMFDNWRGTGGVLFDYFVDLVDVACRGEVDVVAPVSLKACVGKYWGGYNGARQEDAQEFLIWLLDMLHEDTNVATRGPKLKRLNLDNLSIPTPYSVFQSLNNTSRSQLHYKIVYTSSPPTKQSTKITYLKRFLPEFNPETGELKFRKVNTFVDFPVWGLDIWPYVDAQGRGDVSRDSCIYDLYAIANHEGGFEYGHYTAQARNVATNQWHDFNDSHVTPINEDELEV